MVDRTFFPAYCGTIFFLVWAQWPASDENAIYLFSKVIKYNVKGTQYILYTIIFKYFVIACTYFEW